MYIGKRRRSARIRESRRYPYINTAVLAVHFSMSLTICSQQTMPERQGQNTAQLPRKSTQLREIRNLSQQKFKQAEKRTRSSSRITTTQHGIGQRPPRAEVGILKTPKKCQLTLCCEYYHSMLTSAAKLRRVPVDKDETQHESSLASPEVKEACQLPPARLRS